MHEAVDILEDALPTTDPIEAYTVAHKALASALKVIARADDSSGIIGDACRRLLALHPKLAATAHVPVSRLVTWMMAFQFEGEVDFFELDPKAYAPALGDRGLSEYRSRLEQVRSSLAPEPPTDTWEDPDRYKRWVLDWNARRLAVLDRDIDAIVRTHTRDRKVAAWLHDAAKAFDEIGETELAIWWARQATDFDRGHQAQRAAEYWSALIEEHLPDELVEVRSYVFRRWPTASNASRLHAAAGLGWPEHQADVARILRASPTDAVTFALSTLKDARQAWTLAHELNLTSEHAWKELIMAYERIDPLAVLEIHRQFVESTLTNPGAEHYRDAAQRLSRMRRLAAGSDRARDIDDFIAQLRDTYRRRPRMHQEFDRAKLP